MSERIYRGFSLLNLVGGLSALIAFGGLIVRFGTLPEKVQAQGIYIKHIDEDGTASSHVHVASDERRFKAIEDELDQQRLAQEKSLEAVNKGRTERYEYQAKNDAAHASIETKLDLLLEAYKKGKP